MEKGNWIIIKEVYASHLAGMDEFVDELRKDYTVCNMENNGCQQHAKEQSCG